MKTKHLLGWLLIATPFVAVVGLNVVRVGFTPAAFGAIVLVGGAVFAGVHFLK